MKESNFYTRGMNGASFQDAAAFHSCGGNVRREFLRQTVPLFIAPGGRDISISGFSTKNCQP